MKDKLSPGFRTILFCLVILAAAIQLKPAAGQTVALTLTPAADAYVNQSYPGSNYGSSAQLRVDGSPLVYSYLRFVVAGLNGSVVSSATLRIYANSASSAGVAAYREPDQAWTERGITYTNAPGFGARLGQSGPFGGGTWISIDVSAAVTGEGEVDFGLGGLNSTAISLGAREDSAHAPQLVLVTQSQATATAVTLAPSASFTPTLTPTATLTASYTATITPTATLVESETATITPTATLTASDTATSTPAATETATATPVQSATFTLTATSTATQPETPTALPSPSGTATSIPGATPTPTFTLTPSPFPISQPVLFVPTADAYVNQSYPTSNYGSSTQLRVDGSPLVTSYLRFVVSGLNGAAVSSATLRIYANSASSAGVAAYRELDQAWAEKGITYNNAPAFGARLGQSGPFVGGTWTSIDVSPAVTGEGEIDFGLGGLNSTAISLGAHEDSAHAPQLVVVIQGQATVTATLTPQPGLTLTPTVTATVSATATPTVPVTPQPDPVILAAGDIAKCGSISPAPGNGAFITSNMLLADGGNIFTLGDNSNDAGSLADYQNCFGPTWGRLMDRLHITMGNHDIGNAGQDFFTYFSGMTGDWGHYSLNLGSWHIIVLNAECGIGGQGCEPGSIQETWLRQDLATNTQKCVLAMWHQPLFTSGTQSPYPGMETFWQDLYAYGADVILNGHNHNYERFDPQNPDAGADPNGIREFVVGTGGASLDSSSLPLAANQVVRSAAAYGYLRLTLHTDGYDWQFVAQPGSSFTDSGSATCH